MALPYRDPACSDNDSISNRAVDVIFRLTISPEATREVGLSSEATREVGLSRGSSLHFGRESFESHAQEELFNTRFIRLLFPTQSIESWYLSLS